MLLCGTEIIYARTALADSVGSYPDKPIKLVVGYTPGGGADIMGRLIAGKISEALGQQVVVENKPGASQDIAAHYVAKSPADGYTLFMSSSALGVNVSLRSKLNYDPIKDFAPIAIFAQSPNLLLIRPGLPVNSVKELVDYAKKHPGKLNFSSSGSGSTQHLSGELLKLMTGIQATHVPYRGTAPSLTALLAGQVDFTFANIPSAKAFVTSRKLKALAITSAKRSPLFPNLPTMIESGLDGFDVTAWYGILAPAGTSPSIIAKLNSVVVKAVQQQDFRTRLEHLGAIPIAESPEYFSKFLKDEISRWRKVITASHIPTQ